MTINKKDMHMILFISPAKTFRKTTQSSDNYPIMKSDTLPLLAKLKSMSAKTLAKHMKISLKVAETTHEYYQNFDINPTPAIYTYFGHQYKHINPDALSEKQIRFMNDHLYIMDGLYGLLKPLDLISYYRLEMQDKTIKNLYKYWTPKITDYLKQSHKDDVFINLASNEYGQIIKDLNQTYTIEFYQQKNDKLSIHSMEAKKLRGLMVHHICKHQLTSVDDLYAIEIEGYRYSQKHSKEKTILFIKEL
jgi:cytoplasmic iron level regulating protein YaaA (DUF328/UPF0246 family)